MLSFFLLVISLTSCTQPTELKVTQNPSYLASLAPQITKKPMDQVVSLNSPAQFDFIVTGGAPINLEWQLNGLAMSAAAMSNIGLIEAIERTEITSEKQKLTVRLSTSRIVEMQLGDYRLIAKNKFGMAIAEFILDTIRPPPNPINLTGMSPTTTQILLQWTSGGGSTVDYRMSYQTGTVAPASCATATQFNETQINGTSHMLTNLTANTNYSFRLCAINNNPIPDASPGITLTVKTLAVPPPLQLNPVTDAPLSMRVSSTPVILNDTFINATATCQTGCVGISRNGGPFLPGPVEGFNAGDSLAIQIVTAATLNTTRTATVTVGSITSNSWTVRTLPTDPCSLTDIPIGSICLDGTVFIGITPDALSPLFVTRCDHGQIFDAATAMCKELPAQTTWNNGSSHFIFEGLTDVFKGRYNSIVLSLRKNLPSPYNAAKVCEDLNLNSRTDWYLPSESEFALLKTNQSQLNNPYLLFEIYKNGKYWTSTEKDEDSSVAYSPQIGESSPATKNSLQYIRCSRNRNPSLLPRVALLSPMNTVERIEGSPLEISVVAEGHPLLNYQWRFNSADLVGETLPTYRIDSVAKKHAGGYSVRISNDLGEVLSSNVYLVVKTYPKLNIVNPPDGTVVTRANMAKFRVSGTCSHENVNVTFQYGNNLTSTTPCINEKFSSELDLTTLPINNFIIIAKHTNDLGEATDQVQLSKTLDTIVTMHYPDRNIVEESIINSTNVSNFQVGGSCSENSVDVLIHHNNVQINSAKCESGYWSVFLNLTQITDGAVILKALHSTAEVTREFEKHMTLPTLFTLTSAPTITNETESNYELKGRCSSDVTKIRVTMVCNAGGECSSFYKDSIETSCVNENWSVTRNYFNWPETHYTLTATGYNASQNPLQRTLQVYKDTVANTIKITSHVNGQVITQNSQEMRIRGTCTEIDRSFEVYANDVLAYTGACNFDRSKNNGYWDANGIDSSRYPGETLKIKVTLTDRSGAVAEDSITLVRDLSEQLITIEEPHLGFQLTSDNYTNVLFSGRCSNTAEPVTLKLTNTQIFTCKSDLTWEGNVDFTDIKSIKGTEHFINFEHKHYDGTKLKQRFFVNLAMNPLLTASHSGNQVFYDYANSVRFFGFCSSGDPTVKVKHIKDSNNVQLANLAFTAAPCVGGQWSAHLDLTGINASGQYSIRFYQNINNVELTAETSIDLFAEIKRLQINANIQMKLVSLGISPHTSTIITQGHDQQMWISRNNGANWDKLCQLTGQSYQITDYYFLPGDNELIFGVDSQNRLLKLSDSSKANPSGQCQLSGPGKLSEWYDNNSNYGSAAALSNSGLMWTAQNNTRCDNGEACSLTLWHSEDRGQTWKTKGAIFGSRAFANSLAMDVSQDVKLSLLMNSNVSQKNGLYASNDKGRTFQKSSSTSFRYLFFDNLGQNILTYFMSNSNGEYSLDRGANWLINVDKYKNSEGTIGLNGHAVRINRNSQNYRYELATNTNISSSNWITKLTFADGDNKEKTNQRIQANKIAFIYDGFIRLSQDQGTTFTDIKLYKDPTQHHIHDLETVNGKDIYMLTEKGGMLKSNDSGANWVYVNSHHNLTNINPESLFMSQFKSDSLVAWENSVYNDRFLLTKDDFATQLSTTFGMVDWHNWTAFSDKDPDVIYRFTSSSNGSDFKIGRNSSFLHPPNTFTMVTAPLPFSNTSFDSTDRRFIVSPQNSSTVWGTYTLDETNTTGRGPTQNMRLFEYNFDANQAVDITTRTGLYVFNDALGIDEYRVAGIELVKSGADSILRTISRYGEISDSLDYGKTFVRKSSQTIQKDNRAQDCVYQGRFVKTHPRNKNVILTGCQENSYYVFVSYNAGETWSESFEMKNSAPIRDAIFNDKNQIIFRSYGQTYLYNLKQAVEQ